MGRLTRAIHCFRFDTQPAALGLTIGAYHQSQAFNMDLVLDVVFEDMSPDKQSPEGIPLDPYVKIGQKRVGGREIC